MHLALSTRATQLKNAMQTRNYQHVVWNSSSEPKVCQFRFSIESSVSETRPRVASNKTNQRLKPPCALALVTHSCVFTMLPISTHSMFSIKAASTTDTQTKPKHELDDEQEFVLSSPRRSLKIWSLGPCGLQALTTGVLDR